VHQSAGISAGIAPAKGPPMPVSREHSRRRRTHSGACGRRLRGGGMKAYAVAVVVLCLGWAAIIVYVAQRALEMLP